MNPVKWIFLMNLVIEKVIRNALDRYLSLLEKRSPTIHHTYLIP